MLMKSPVKDNKSILICIIVLCLSFHSKNQATCTDIQHFTHSIMIAGGSTLSLIMIPAAIYLHKKQTKHRCIMSHMTNKAQRDFSNDYDIETQEARLFFTYIWTFGGLILTATGTVLRITLC